MVHLMCAVVQLTHLISAYYNQLSTNDSSKNSKRYLIKKRHQLIMHCVDACSSLLIHNLTSKTTYF